MPDLAAAIKEHERQVQHEMRSCVHFNGIQHPACEAGVNYAALVGGPAFGWAKLIPCLSDPGAPCSKFRLPTREEAEAAVTARAIRAAERGEKERNVDRRGAYKGPLPVVNDRVTEIRIKSANADRPGTYVLRLTDSLCELAEQKVRVKHGKPSWELPTGEGANAWSETLMELMMERATFEPEASHA